MAEADGIRMTIDDKELQKYMKKVLQRFGTLMQVWPFVEATLHNSISRNFQTGGRPERWAKHKPATVARRERDGTLRNAMQPVLQEHGRLRGSLGTINVKKKKSFEYGFDATLSVAKKGIFLQEGVKGRMEARPFVLMQDADAHEITGRFASYVFPDK